MCDATGVLRVRDPVQAPPVSTFPAPEGTRLLSFVSLYGDIRTTRHDVTFSTVDDTLTVLNVSTVNDSRHGM